MLNWIAGQLQGIALWRLWKLAISSLSAARVQVTMRRFNPALASSIGSAILISLDPAAGVAQNLPGAPASIVGTFGNSRAQCQSYHRKGADDIFHIDKDFYSSCGGSLCGSTIVSHRKTADGYILRLTSRGNPQGSNMTIRQPDPDVIELVDAGVGGRTEKLVRCTIEDAVAGIGQSVGTGFGNKGRNLEFSAYYARAIPTACPDLKVREAEVERTLKLAKAAWIAHLERHKLVRPGSSVEAQAEYWMEVQQGSATSAVREDARLITNFCKDVLEVFGTDGRVLPGLIVDNRQRT